MNHRASLSVRLLAGQLALAVLLVAAIVVVTTEITRQLLYDEVETQWRNVIGLLQNTLNAEPALFTQGKLHALFHPFADRTPGVARFSAVDHTLTVIEDSDNAREGLPTDQATLIRVIEQGRGETFIYRRGGITYLRLSEPIFGKYDPVRKSNVVGAIALDISLAAADRRVSGVLFNIGGLAALVLAVFFTVQYFLTRRAVFTPLNRLSAQALAIGRGDWETPIEVRRIDEIGRLAAALEAARLNLTEQAAKRDQIQASLLDANQTLRTLIAASPLAIASFDLDNHVRLWNPAAERLLGWRRSEAVGQRLPIIPESEGERFYAAREKVARGESVAQLEFTLQRKDGSPVEVSVSASPVRDAQGSIIGLLTMAVDVTERKQAEARLRQQSAALEAAANAIVITDREGIIQWVNPAFTRLTGYAPPEAAGQTPRLLKSGAHDAAFFRAMWETILAGQEWHGEIVNRRKDGSLYTEEETITPVRDGSGAISHFVAIKQTSPTASRRRPPCRKPTRNWPRCFSSRSEKRARRKC